MGLDTRAIAIWFAATLAVGVAMFVYRQHLGSDADPITKTLCNDKPVISGQYGQCLQHYAPAAERG
jgi:hypothetical protein